MKRQDCSTLVNVVARRPTSRKCLQRAFHVHAIENVAKAFALFLVDMRSAIGNGLTIRPIETMMNHHTTELFFDNLEIPANTLIGEEGKGFRYVLDSMNVERTLIAFECIGDCKFFIERAKDYACDRKVFDRPIGSNQGIISGSHDAKGSGQPEDRRT